MKNKNTANNYLIPESGIIVAIICIFAAILSPANAQDSTTLNISVYGIKGIGISQQLARSLQEHLESNLLKYDNFSVMSRSDIDLILAENRISQSGLCYDEECLVKAGHLLGIHKIVTGTISRLGSTHNIVLKLIDVKSGKLESSANGRHSGNIDQLLDVCERLLDEMLVDMKKPPMVDTVIVETIDTVIAVDTVVIEKNVVIHEPHTVDNAYATKRKEDYAQTNEPAAPAAPSTMRTVSAKTIGRGALILLGVIAVTVLGLQFIGS